jgi:hypothetical protein
VPVGFASGTIQPWVPATMNAETANSIVSKAAAAARMNPRSGQFPARSRATALAKAGITPL